MRGLMRWWPAWSRWAGMVQVVVGTLTALLKKKHDAACKLTALYCIALFCSWKQLGRPSA